MPNKAFQALIDDPNLWSMGVMPSLPKGAITGLLGALRGAQPVTKAPLHPLAPVEMKAKEVMDEVLPTPKMPEAWEGLKKIKALFGS